MQFYMQRWIRGIVAWRDNREVSPPSGVETADVCIVSTFRPVFPPTSYTSSFLQNLCSQYQTRRSSVRPSQQKISEAP